MQRVSKLLVRLKIQNYPVTALSKGQINNTLNQRAIGIEQSHRRLSTALASLPRLSSPLEDRMGERPLRYKLRRGDFFLRGSVNSPLKNYRCLNVTWLAIHWHSREDCVNQRTKT